MSSTMADGEEAIRNIRLRKQLAVAVKSMQWNYAIFWSSSQTQYGVLEWGEGYYNGDIRKRKNKSYEADSTYGLQRSKQLRNLYLIMLEGDTKITTTHGHGRDTDDKTSSNVMLSADALSDEEWYYLVCMSYVFAPAQCLPGKALATDDTIWLCNAQHAETKHFTRSLLARSASIQTVVCFPYLGGVIELGVTDLIAEDPNLIQHIKDCLLETSNPDCSEMYISEGNSQHVNLKDGNLQFWSKPDEGLQYKKTLVTVLRFATNRPKRKDLASSDFGSTFLRWKSQSVTSHPNNHQKQSNVLWKILHDVPLMHYADEKKMFQAETTGLNQRVSMECDDDDPSDKSEENEKFSVLKTMVPTVNELDKASVLNNTIKYLLQLEARVKELESRMGQIKPTMKENMLSELIEETSETEQGMVRDETHVRVKLKESEVFIEVRCLYRDYIVADIMEAVSNLNMDAFSIESHSHDGVLVLNLKAKFRGDAVTSVGMIRRELKRLACES
ncbi:PREDICTED: transcription factor MYC1-like [Camelina sativa]|uniref:Transcription factor MYC1-like n=1 Tax=Camelina sativa TaxID=90675 RepID=A0ABM0YI99_CAMSA|nr:PREDICTED: transcription factor MYC1-like [Camelina sativa]